MAGFARHVQFQSTSTARSPTKHRLSLRTSKWQTRSPSTGADSAAARIVGSARSSQSRFRRPNERNGAGSDSTMRQRPQSSGNVSRAVRVFGGGAAAPSSFSAVRTDSTRTASQRGVQSASLRSSIASTGRTPSSSHPTNAGMKLPESDAYTSCSRRTQSAMFAASADFTNTRRPSASATAKRSAVE